MLASLCLIVVQEIVIVVQDRVDIQDRDRVTVDDVRGPGSVGEEAHHGDFCNFFLNKKISCQKFVQH